MKFVESKKIIQDLVSKSESHTIQYDENSMKTNFIQPFFEALGWDFQTDVKDPIDDTAADKIFQIDGVTRFYLKILPYDVSIESFRKQIESLVGLAYNKGVTWAIVTNFKEMRVYNTEAPGSSLAAMQHFSFTESEYVTKFDNYLSDLTKHQFSLNVLDSDAEYFGKKPKRIPIDKQLLEDLLSFRNLLVSDIVKNNSINEENAVQTAQKILNRLIFVRSCGDRQIEDRHLKSSLSSWEENKTKTLMQYLQEIFVYFNGRYGSTLFEKHSCDSLIISDGILKDVINGLYKSKQKAVEYNFAHIEHDSLGKMYENYLGTVQQKKDGAYYTPSYISKYICENTIIPYLSKSNTTTIPDLISEYENDLAELESKIHDIKILDPACGTGEFLIRAIDVLLEISKQIQRKKELQGKYQTVDSTSRKAPRSLKKKKSDRTTFQTFDKDIENQQLRTIIQNNIHGVDINEEAIEITQLNLFLKLATSSQKLIDLSKKIRVGNSLIDDPNVDPNAFDWEKEFPEKFDIVIGNPPYVRQEKFKEIKPYLSSKFFSYSSIADLYVYFVEKGLTLLKSNGILSLILPNKFIKAEYGKNLRKFLINKKIELIYNFDDYPVFEKATTYPIIIIIQNINNNTNELTYSELIDRKTQNPILELNKNQFNFPQSSLSENSWIFVKPEITNIFKKIVSRSIPLKDIVSNKIFRGISSGKNDVFFIDQVTKNNLEKDFTAKKSIKKLVTGSAVKKFVINFVNEFLLFIPWEYDINSSASIKQYLSHHKDDLEKRPEVVEGRFNWWVLSRYGSTNVDYLTKPKIIYPRITKNCNFCLDESGEIFLSDNNFFISSNSKSLLAILNSNLVFFFLKNHCPTLRGGYYDFRRPYIEQIPITKTSDDSDKILTKLVCEIILNKNIISSLHDEEKIIQINNKIKKIENQIDEIVYKLYDITDEEKAIIESSI